MLCAKYQIDLAAPSRLPLGSFGYAWTRAVSTSRQPVVNVRKLRNLVQPSPMHLNRRQSFQSPAPSPGAIFQTLAIVGCLRPFVDVPTRWFHTRSQNGNPGVV